MKKISLTVSFLGTVLGYVLFNTRDFGFCEISCADWVGKYQNIFLFFPILLIFSVSFFFLSEKMFLSWWKFARIAIPLILFLSWVISLGLHHTQGGFFNMDNALDLLGLMILYAIFVIGSIVQIWKGYRSK